MTYYVIKATRRKYMFDIARGHVVSSRCAAALLAVAFISSASTTRTAQHAAGPGSGRPRYGITDIYLSPRALIYGRF